MPGNTVVHVQLGTAFWLLIAMIIGGLAVWSVLGSEGMSRVLGDGVKDAFGR